MYRDQPDIDKVLHNTGLILTKEEHMIENLNHLPDLGKINNEFLLFNVVYYTERLENTNNNRRNYFKGDYINLILSWKEQCAIHSVTYCTKRLGFEKTVDCYENDL